MKKILNVLDRLGNVEEVGGGIWQSGFWYRPGQKFDFIRVFHDRDGLSVKGGAIQSVEPYGERTVITFQDDALEHGKSAPKRFGQNGCATTFESATISALDKRRLEGVISILADKIPNVKSYLARHGAEIVKWQDGIGGYINALSRNKINLKLWLDRTQFENESLFYLAFDSSDFYSLMLFVRKYFASDFEVVRGGREGGDYEWDDASARLHLRDPIEPSRAALPRWETFPGERGDEYYFGLNQYLEESEGNFLARAFALFSGPINIEWGKKLSRHEILQKARAWDENFRNAAAVERRRQEIARNPYLVEVALSDAKGKCQSCKACAPFHTTADTPYLEVHHINSLSRGGTDTLDNMVAICPNCHRQAHFGKNADFINKKLRRVAAKLSSQ